MTVVDELPPGVRIGNEAGWLLEFDRSTEPTPPDGYPSIGSDRFYASIQASLPSGLEGGTYRFVVEALPDDMYDQIRRGQPTSPDVVRLFLFWHDSLTAPVGYLRNLTGLTGSTSAVRPELLKHGSVAELSIVRVSRTAGTRHYETTITARERVFELLANTKLCGRGIDADAPDIALTRLAERLPILRGHRFYGLEPHPNPPRPRPAIKGASKVELESGRSVSELLTTLATSMEERTNRHGRGMLLIRDGVLHVGTRPIPLLDPPIRLSLATGLLEVEALQPVVTDPNFDYCEDGNKKPPERRQYKLTMKGRPDLKPGHVVTFIAPPTEQMRSLRRPGGLLGDLSAAPLLPSLTDEKGDKITLYVQSVDHLVSRVSAFATTVFGVELREGQDAWDAHTPARLGAAPEQFTANPVAAAAHAVQGLARRVVEVRRFPDVGEVRTATPSGAGEPPGQTELVWRGLGPPDGLGNQARRLPIERMSPSPIEGVAYATPFAWGTCGLVLPRYPGTRVLLVHRDGRGDDPVDIGTLWPSAHAPSNAEAGDWWLILPAEVPEADRAAIPDSKVPEDYTGKVTNDLIDADGNRCIEVGRLTVRVGKDGLQPAGTRPAVADADVSIEHADGITRLIVKQDGTIELHAKKNIELSADGDINLTATNVNVQVDTAMKVT